MCVCLGLCWQLYTRSGRGGFMPEGRTKREKKRKKRERKRDTKLYIEIEREMKRDLGRNVWRNVLGYLVVMISDLCFFF